MEDSSYLVRNVALDILNELKAHGGEVGEAAGVLMEGRASYGRWLGAQRELAAVMLGEREGAGEAERGGGEGGVCGKRGQDAFGAK